MTLSQSLYRLMINQGREQKRWPVKRGDLLHVSDLFSACFRQLILQQRENIISQDVIVKPQMRLKWDQALAVEKRILQTLLEGGILHRQPDGNQEELKDSDLGIVGHIDGRLGNGMVLEIKAYNARVFTMCKNKPQPKNRFQVESYLMLDGSGKAVLLYVERGDLAFPFAEHIISRNKQTEEIIRQSVSMYREAEAGGPLPHRICNSQSDARAVSCPVAAQCFALSNVKVIKPIGQLLEYR